MNPIVIDPAIIKALGWTLLHSIWQGGLIFLCLWILLKTVQLKSPQLRYGLSLSALLVWVVWMAVSLVGYLPGPEDLPAISERTPTSVLHVDEFQEAAALTLDVPVMSTQTEKSLSKKLVHQLSFWVDLYAHQLVKIWFLGVCLFGFRWFISIYYTYRLRVVKTQPLPSQWQEKLNHLATQMGISQTVQLLESAKVEVPLIIGHLRPTILFPLGAFTGLTPGQIEAVLIHELAHIRRHDYLINMILSGLEILLFYHPAFWWIANVIRQERENCCDDIAIATCGNPRFYARTLLIMEEKRQQKSLAMAFQGNKNELLNRIKRICLAPQHSNRNDFSRAGLMLGLFLTLGVCAWAALPNAAEEIVSDIPTKIESLVERNASLLSIESKMEELEVLTRTATDAEPEEANITTDPGPEELAQPTPSVSIASSNLIILRDTVPYPKLPKVQSPKLSPIPKFPYSMEQLQAKHQQGESYQALVASYKERIDNWRESYSKEFIEHWEARQDKIHELYKQWISDVKRSHSGDELAAAVEVNQSRIFEKALKEQEQEMSKSEKAVDREIEDKIREVERTIKADESKAEDHDAKMAIHDDRMAVHDLRMSVHDIRMEMHDARMKVHDTRMSMHDERMAAHDIIMAAFKKEFYAALLEDGLIKSKSDEFEVQVRNGKVEFNGKALDSNLSEKYLKMFKKYGFRVEERNGAYWGVKMGKNGTSIGVYKRNEE